MPRKTIRLELLPEERHALLRWNFTPALRSQLEPWASNSGVVTIRLTSVDLNWLISDLNHAIVKKGCRDDVVIELVERLEYVEQTGDGKLADW